MTEPTIEETEAEVEEFTDELSDEALDREQGGLPKWCPVPGGPGNCKYAFAHVPVTDR